jgi:hypothetical protein
MLTAEELKNRLNYNPRTGVFTWIRSKRSTLIGCVAGCASKPNGYLRIVINYKLYFAHKLAWLYAHGRWPSEQLDHINHNKLDNRLNNLREVSHRENHLNQSLSKNSTTGLHGVSFHRRANKYEARIKVDGKSLYLGSFQTSEEAYAARKLADSKHGFYPNHGLENAK